MCTRIGRLRQSFPVSIFRLLLERSTSARHAVDVVTSLIDRHGQGGTFGDSLAFCGAFLIADRKEAWLVECAGRFWTTKQIKGRPFTPV